MKKLYIVKHQQDFDRIIKLNNKKVSSYFIIYSEDNDKKYDDRESLQKEFCGNQILFSQPLNYFPPIHKALLSAPWIQVSQSP